ncbi:type II CAAX endopeptidase family protein [Synechococcus sp. M16CYN]|uniref:CPBP family intramembrane glutamic endopeptidase n=1 Tax=Synechococcus sp. M16CYN TaxID=3103139 RepID=UPI0030DF9302
MLLALLNSFLLLQPRYLPLLFIIPLLYGLGWLIAIALAPFGLASGSISLTGTLLSFFMFLALMPRWVDQRWGEKDCWMTLGIRRRYSDRRPSHLRAMMRGLLIALVLLSVVTIPALLCGWGTWLGIWKVSTSINALMLCLGVGLAEELIFRAWLWEELKRFMGSSSALISQALVFSIVHIRFNLGATSTLKLLISLFFLGIALAAQRYLDNGSLWGCIGLHGGLVGAWFLLQNGLLTLSPRAPIWLVGSSESHTNPLSGTVAIIAFSLLILWQWRSINHVTLSNSES